MAVYTILSLFISCSLSLSLSGHKHFKHFERLAQNFKLLNQKMFARRQIEKENEKERK